MTMRVSSSRIDMDDKVLQKAVLKDYGETVLTASAGDGGYALDFDGTSDYVTISADTDLNNDDFSLAMWVKPDQLRVQGIIDKTTFSNSWRIFMNGGSGTIEFDARSDADNHSTSATLSTDTWYHVVLTYDKSATTSTFYINGSFESENTSFSNAGNDQNNNIRLAPTHSARFDGSIDDVRIFNRALSSGEVSTIYSGGSVTSGLYVHLPMNEGSGTTASDASGNGNDGTLTGTPSWVAGGLFDDYTLDLVNGNVFNITLTGNCAFTFANPPSSGISGTFTLLLSQDSTGSWLAGWPSAVTWLGGSAPTLSTAANSVNILTFSTIDGGTTWYGAYSGSTGSEIKYGFDSGVDGFLGNNATVTASGGKLIVDSTAGNPQVYNYSVSIDGSVYTQIEVSVKRTAGTTGWDGSVFFGNAGHGFSGSYKFSMTQPTWDGTFKTITLDGNSLAAGGDDWVTNTNTSIRFDFGADASDDFEVDYIKFTTG